MVKIRLPMPEMWVLSLDWKDPLEGEMTIHSSIHPFEIPWTEEPGRLQSMGSQNSQTRLSTAQHIHIYISYDKFYLIKLD